MRISCSRSAGVITFGAQTWRGKNVYFGDAHWHSCLSQDADRGPLDSRYESMLYDYQLDFSLESDHAEAATAGINESDETNNTALIA